MTEAGLPAGTVMTAKKERSVRRIPRGQWCAVQQPKSLSPPEPSVRPHNSFRSVSTGWFVDVPSERAAPAVVIPELPRVIPAGEPSEPLQAEVWLVRVGSGWRVLPASSERPVGARLMRLVAIDDDDAAHEMLQALATRRQSQAR